jgi:hypothetical protein
VTHLNYYVKDFDDYDISLYSNYIAKLAAVAAVGDPPPLTWRGWFSQHYHAMPGHYRPDSSRQEQARACRASLRHGRSLAADRHPDLADGDAVA